MNKKNESPFTEEELLKDLPPERTMGEILKDGKYKAVYKQCLKEYRASRKKKTKSPKPVAAARSKKSQERR